ncbi:MAG: hypothetical protein WC528_00715 [Patescibacteria group bacterium]
MRLRIPLILFVFIVTTALMSSCSYANAGVRPNPVDMITVNGIDEYMPTTADMPINLITRAEKFTAIRTSSSVFSPKNEKYNAVMNAVGSLSGINPVIIGNDVAVSNVNSTNTPAIYARNQIRDGMRSGSSTDTGEANLPWGISPVVKAVIVHDTIMV